MLNQKEKYKKEQIVIIIIIVCICINLSFSFGRYVVNEIKDFYFKSREFYFNSDKLRDDIAVYQINNWSGIDPYIITVNMNSRKNNIKKVDYDIKYNIEYTCTSNATCQLSKNSGVILANTNSDFFNLVITPNRGLKAGEQVVVTITATSDDKYSKVLEGRFTLVVGKEKVDYEIVDETKNKYMILNITNTISYYKAKEAFLNYAVGDKIDVNDYEKLSDVNKKKCYSANIKLKFNPNDILLDMTDSNYLKSISHTTRNINGSNFIDSITFEINPVSSAKVRFYKRDVNMDYTYPIVNNNSIVQVIVK